MDTKQTPIRFPVELTLALADCLIAATAVENGLTLVTKNIRHFPCLS